jgi:hypothetical protein
VTICGPLRREELLADKTFDAVTSHHVTLQLRQTVERRSTLVVAVFADERFRRRFHPVTSEVFFKFGNAKSAATNVAHEVVFTRRLIPCLKMNLSFN